MTETITQSISKMKGVEYKQDETQSYRNEKALLHTICSVSGISLYDFAEAYFEEPDLHSPYGERMPKWHKLQRALTEAFGPKFLLSIDESIRSDAPKNGINWDKNKILGLIQPDDQGRTQIEKMHEEWTTKGSTSSS